jgi:hypothetical protein
MKRFPVFVFLFFEMSKSGLAFDNQKDSSLLFFPHTRIFPSIFLDPLECQINGGSNFLFRKGSDISLYSLVNLGFIKPVIARHSESYSWELNFGAAAFTQFDLIRMTNGSYLAGLLNNDYKISADFSLQKKNNVFRFRVFHISSHLGDDYMLRHNDTLPNNKSDNYEQADLTFLRLKGNNYWYLGAGEIYTKYAFRKRFSIQGGGLLNYRKSEAIDLFTSVNLKLLAENSYIPDMRIALGLNINRKSESMMRIWLEYYSGQLPYSTLNYGRVNWIGMAMCINLY